ncbi:hypothetical protein F4861DRAFT_81746 [Xylaria intraflava]|nr:hypothetical protein F4861DRAFT_81746 [Xylaria intraflava]
MKQRIISRGIRAKTHGFHVRQTRYQSTFQQRFSITVPSGASQRHVLDQLSTYVPKIPPRSYHGSPVINGVAVLASRDFTSWSEDKNFMSAFLETLFKPTRTSQTNHLALHVLSGITDGIGPRRLSSEPCSGFSVLWGPTDKVLPGLWGEGSVVANQDGTACVSFVTNPLAGDTGALEVTLPLANTVFQNGRRSTLYASEWDMSSTGSVTLRTREPRTIQRIAASGDSVNHMSSIIPLLPITPPRKIIAGLGNIVRQVEVDGSVTPASKELESVIPDIFDERARRDPVSSPTPIGVWCWVIPPHVMESQSFDNLQLFNAGSSQTEADITLGSMKLFSELLSSGCRLHKILSGGGGWGLKQGLLSLDPETAFSLPGKDDDMEMFIRSFEQRNSIEAIGGFVTPGSFLLFCVEPQVTNPEAPPNQFAVPTKSFAFGVTSDLDHTPSPNSQPSPVEIIDGHFGASSTTGIFLRKIPGLAGTSSESETKGTPQSPYTTKINVPGAYLCV